METPGKSKSTKSGVVGLVASSGKRKANRISSIQDATPATSIHMLALDDFGTGTSSSHSYVSSTRTSSSQAVVINTTDIIFIDGSDDEDDSASLQLALQLQEEEYRERAEQHRLDNERSMLYIRQEKDSREQSLMNMKYSCEICLQQDICLSDMVTLSCQPVGHRFCASCFNDYCVSKISEAQVDSTELVCPTVGCKTAITPHELKANVSAETYSRFEKFILRAICKENDWKCCPHCSDWFADIPSDLENAVVWCSVECQNLQCLKTFCGRCGQEPHAKIKNGAIELTCEEFAKKKADEQQDAPLRELATLSGWRQCPRCKHMSELIAGGCKFVYCTCKARFCYLCGVELTQAQHYSHFQGPGCTGPFGMRCLGTIDGVRPPQPPAVGQSQPVPPPQGFIARMRGRRHKGPPK